MFDHRGVSRVGDAAPFTFVLQLLVFRRRLLLHLANMNFHYMPAQMLPPPVALVALLTVEWLQHYTSNKKNKFYHLFMVVKIMHNNNMRLAYIKSIPLEHAEKIISQQQYTDDNGNHEDYHHHDQPTQQNMSIQ